MAAKHILVLRFSALGDVAMCLPVLRCLIQTYPELRITVVTRKRFAVLFEELPNTIVFRPDFNIANKGIVGFTASTKHCWQQNPTPLLICIMCCAPKYSAAISPPDFGYEKQCLTKAEKQKNNLQEHVKKPWCHWFRKFTVMPKYLSGWVFQSR